MTNVSEFVEVTEISQLTRMELREFCLQIVFQKSKEKKYQKIMDFILSLAQYLEEKDLTPKQRQALQKIIDRNQWAYHRVPYLQRTRKDLMRSIERTRFYETIDEESKVVTHRKEKVIELFLECFQISDITSVEVLQQLEDLARHYSYEEIESAFLRVRRYRYGKSLNSIFKILENARNQLESGKQDEKTRQTVAPKLDDPRLQGNPPVKTKRVW